MSEKHSERDRSHDWSKERVEPGIYRRVSPTVKKGETAPAVKYVAEIRMARATARATFRTLSKARKWRAATLADIEADRYFGDMPGAKLPFADAVTAYLEAKGVTQKSDPTRYRRAMFWSDQFGKLPVLEVTSDKVAIAAAEIGHSSATVNRYLAVLSAMWKHWSTDRVGSPALVPLRMNPASSVERGADSPERVVTLSKPQRDALLAACAGDVELRAAIGLSLSSGCRHGELARLTWADVDLESRTAVLHRTKNGQRRAITFDPGTAEALRSFTRGVGKAPVFSERVRNRNLLRSPWKAALKNAGLPDMRWHDLRHVSVALAIESGASLMEAGLHSGHNSLSALKRYAHLETGHRSRLADRIAEVL